MSADLWDLSDEELEIAFRNAKAELDSPITDVENNDIEGEDLEQPLEDSDDNGTEEITLEDDVVEPDDTQEPDGEPDESTEPPTTEDDKDVDLVQEVQKYKFKANGREYELTDDEMRSQFPKIFGQAMDYTRKTQALKPWRKTIDALEQAKLSHEDVSLMIDVIRGDKQAIAEVIKRTGTDTLELDTENSGYTPKNYGRDDTALAMEEVIKEISGDKEYEITHKVLAKEWDDQSFAEFTKNPDLIKDLHEDVKSGVFDKVQPIAEKYKVFDRGRKTDLEYYLMAGEEYYGEKRRMEAIENQRIQREAKLQQQSEIARVKAEQVERQKTTEKVVQRKAAAPVKAAAGTKKVVDYLDDSDEAYEEWYKKVEASR